MTKPKLMNKQEHEVAGFEQFEPGKSQANKIKPKTDGPALIRINVDMFSFGIWTFVLNKDKTHARLDGISRDGFITLVNQKGYFKRYRADNAFQYIQEKDNIIKSVEVSQIRDDITDYVKHSKFINQEWEGIPFKASKEQQKETFFRNSPSLFNDAILGHLPNHVKPILHDNETEMFFPFHNCFVKVTSEGLFTMAYAELKDVCIWKDHINERSFLLSDDVDHALFAAFIKNVATNEEKGNTDTDRLNAFYSAIGYLLHNYSDPTTARAVIAYDEQIAGTREPAGGTGKGVFNQGIKQLRNTAIIDGKKISDKNQFSYQMVTERTQIISFDDVKPDFDFLTLNSNLTTGWQIEWKNKGAFRFPPSENPKTYITSNTILRAEGPTAKRRQFIIEFSPYYSKLVQQNIEPIIHTHGGMFFTSDWSNNEWDRFFTFMLNCAKYYLENGLQFYKLRAVAENKLIQTTSDDFSEWIKGQEIKPETEFSISDWFADFKAMYFGIDNDFKQRTFNNWLKTFASTMGWKLENKRSNGKSIGLFTSKK